MIETMGKPYKDIDEAVKHILDDVQNRIDEAYQRGFDDGKKAFDLLDAERDSEYQRGLDDVWECMKKIAFLEKPRDMRDFFGCSTLGGVLIDYSASEAIAKLKAYEEKQKTDNCIEIGDEVEWDGDKYIVTYRNTNMGVIQDYDLMSWYGSVVAHVKRCSFVKTGRHFDIDKILEEMKE